MSQQTDANETYFPIELGQNGIAKKKVIMLRRPAAANRRPRMQPRGGGFKNAIIATSVISLTYFFRRIVRSSHFRPLVSPAI